MKVKVLNATLEAYWYSDSIGEEFDVIYVIKDRDNTYRQTDKPRYIRNVDAVITELPESFCVKRCDDKDKWEKYIQWLNKTYFDCYMGNCDGYYGSIEGSSCYEHVSFGTEIHIDDMIKHLDYMETKDSITVKYENGKFIEVKEEFNMNTVEGRLAYAKKHYPIGCTVIEVSGEKFKSKVKEIHTSVNNSIKLQFGAGLLYNNITGEWAEIIKEEINMGTQRLSRQGLKEIHSVACSTWKNTLEQYGSRNPLEDYIELSQKEIDTMFLACTKDQLPIVSKYLKQDDGSVDLLEYNINNIGFLKNGDSILEIRKGDSKYQNKSFWLNNRFDWEIRKDEYGLLCLIPTKKK